MNDELKPCPSTGQAILGAVDPKGAWLRCGDTAGHIGHHRFEMTWRDELTIQPEVLPSIAEEIKRYLESQRDDPDFQRRLHERMAEDADILKRLEGDG